MNEWVPYTSEDYRLDFCNEQAKALRQSGEYADVEVRKQAPERSEGQLVEYGRIYVRRKPVTEQPVFVAPPADLVGQRITIEGVLVEVTDKDSYPQWVTVQPVDGGDRTQRTVVEIRNLIAQRDKS